jgi:hypothetical protein
MKEAGPIFTLENLAVVVIAGVVVYLGWPVLPISVGAILLSLVLIIWNWRFFIAPIIGKEVVVIADLLISVDGDNHNRDLFFNDLKRIAKDCALAINEQSPDCLRIVGADRISLERFASIERPQALYVSIEAKGLRYVFRKKS